MPDEEQLPLDQLIFGPKPGPTAAAESPLAAAISARFREGLSGPQVRPAAKDEKAGPNADGDS